MAGETPQLKLAREEGEKNIQDLEIVTGVNNKPLIKISCAAAELIPTVQYGNCTVGPVTVTRYVEDIGIDNLKNEIRVTQSLCEEAIAEDRQSVHALTRQSTEGRYQG